MFASALLCRLFSDQDITPVPRQLWLEILWVSRGVGLSVLSEHGLFILGQLVTVKLCRQRMEPDLTL